MFVGLAPDGQAILVLLCLRCYHEAFGKESWTKLLGEHPETRRIDDSSDACFDGEFSYAIQSLGSTRDPRSRGPILRLKVPVKDLLDSKFCGFCKILRDLDTEQHLATDRYETAEVDLQLFYPNWSNGTFLPFIVQVSLKLERAEEQSRVNSAFLAITPKRCRLLIELKDNDTLTSPSQEP